MREILFRGKQIGSGEWLYGYYVHQYGEDMIYLPDGTDREYGFDYYYIIPETVGQYTGLTDKNGYMIFEGDIVKFGDIIGVINYNFGCFCVKTNKPDWKSRNNPAIDVVFNEYPNEVEIIGNIHDNPELLKGENDA